MTESELAQVEERLGDLPTPYREFLLSFPDKLDEETANRVWVAHGNVYNTPQAIIEANLVLIDADDWLAGTEWSDLEVSEYMVIGGDGCGNFYIVDPDDDESPVQLLAHDPVGIEEGYASIQDYCTAVKQTISNSD